MFTHTGTPKTSCESLHCDVRSAVAGWSPPLSISEASCAYVSNQDVLPGYSARLGPGTSTRGESPILIYQLPAWEDQASHLNREGGAKAPLTQVADRAAACHEV